MQAIRAAFYKRGVPEQLLVDNGSIYRGQEICQLLFGVRPHSWGGFYGPGRGRRIADQGGREHVEGSLRATQRSASEPSRHWLRDLTVGSKPPLGPSRHFIISRAHGQEVRPVSRPRRCLLKGCERWFSPVSSASRYCSDACRVAARRWRRVQGQPALSGQRRRARAAAGAAAALSAAASRAGGSGVRGRGRRRARASASRCGRRFLRAAVRSAGLLRHFLRSSMNTRAGVFAVWRAAWRYVACWIGKRAIGSGVGVGVGERRDAGDARPPDTS